MRGGSHVRGKDGRGDAGAGSEHASGGLGGEAFEGEGRLGNFARGDGKWEEEDYGFSLMARTPVVHTNLLLLKSISLFFFY